MKKLSKYINNWDIKRSNPLDDSTGVHKLVVVYNAKGVKTKIGSKEISNFAILKEGNNAWGWKHIVSRSHDKQIMEEFGLSDNDEAVKNLIQKALINYDIKKQDPKEVGSCIIDFPMQKNH